MKRKGETRINTKKSILLLLILAAFAIISTYAWFTSNRLVRITPMDVHIQASQGFQISLDAINWKTVIQASDITGSTGVISQFYNNHRNHVPTDFDPFSTAAETAENGDMKMFRGQAAANDTENPTDPDDNFVISAEEVEEEQGTGGFIAFDLFFRTNNVMTLALEQEANVADNATEISRQDKGIENSARVGFVYQGHVAPDTAGSASDIAAIARGKVHDVRDGSNVTIWEPNYLTHTEEARTEMFNMFGIDTTDAEYDAKQEYDGIMAAIPAKAEDDPATTEIDETVAGTFLSENNATDNPDYFKTFDDVVAGVITTPTDRSQEGAKSLGIELQPGITKFRIYMWLEGQDWDCYDNASGSDIQWNLIITKDNTIVTPPTP